MDSALLKMIMKSYFQIGYTWQICIRFKNNSHYALFFILKLQSIRRVEHANLKRNFQK